MEKKPAKTVYIDTDSLVSDVQDETVQAVICPVCLGIVYHPVECEECETLFCESEIETLIGVCPMCKNSNWKQTEYIHKSYKQRLLSLWLKCPSEHCPFHKNKLSYDKYIKHIEQCQFVIFKPKPQHDLTKLYPSQPGQPPCPHKFFQFLYADGLTHKPYNQPDNISLNINYRSKTKQFQLGKYTINMDLKQQLNKATKTKRNIRLDEVENHKHQFWWVSEIETNPFTVYDLKTQGAIETAYRLFVKNKRPLTVKFRYLGREFLIDFQKMVQVNMTTKKSRNVTRLLI